MFIILESFCPIEVCLGECTPSLATNDSNFFCKRPSYSLDCTSLWLLIVSYCQFKRGQHYLLEFLLLKLTSEYNSIIGVIPLQFWPMCTLDSKLQNSHCSATQNRNRGRFLSSVECQLAPGMEEYPVELFAISNLQLMMQLSAPPLPLRSKTTMELQELLSHPVPRSI